MLVWLMVVVGWVVIALMALALFRLFEYVDARLYRSKKRLPVSEAIILHPDKDRAA